MKLNELKPGDRIVDNMRGHTEAILICQTPHLLSPGLNLVIWWIVTEKRFSFDALNPLQDLAPAEWAMPDSPLGLNDWTEARRRNMREALRAGIR